MVNENKNKRTNNFFPNNINAIVDSGASGNYFPLQSPQTKITQSTTPTSITQPNGEKIHSYHNSVMNILHELPIEARKAHAFHHIKYPLISVAKLCDHNCEVHFSKNKLQIIHNNKVIKESPRDAISKLWTLPLKDSNDCNTKHEKNLIMNVTHTQNDNVENLTQFLYGAAGYPVVSTLIKAIQKGNFATWPGFTEKRVRKYLLNNIISAKGHMQLDRQTKIKPKKKNRRFRFH